MHHLTRDSREASSMTSKTRRTFSQLKGLLMVEMPQGRSTLPLSGEKMREASLRM